MGLKIKTPCGCGKYSGCDGKTYPVHNHFLSELSALKLSNRDLNKARVFGPKLPPDGVPVEEYTRQVKDKATS